MSNTSIRRSHPVKPVKPVQGSGIVDQKSALSILRDFYMESKKEIKGATVVSLHSAPTATSLSFVADGFTLELNFTQGRTAI